MLSSGTDVSLLGYQLTNYVCDITGLYEKLIVLDLTEKLSPFMEPFL